MYIFTLSVLYFNIVHFSKWSRIYNIVEIYRNNRIMDDATDCWNALTLDFVHTQSYVKKFHITLPLMHTYTIKVKPAHFLCSKIKTNAMKWAYITFLSDFLHFTQRKLEAWNNWLQILMHFINYLLVHIVFNFFRWFRDL